MTKRETGSLACSAANQRNVDRDESKSSRDGDNDDACTRRTCAPVQ